MVSPGLFSLITTALLCLSNHSACSFLLKKSCYGIEAIIANEWTNEFLPFSNFDANRVAKNGYNGWLKHPLDVLY